MAKQEGSMFGKWKQHCAVKHRLALSVTVAVELRKREKQRASAFRGPGSADFPGATHRDHPGSSDIGRMLCFADASLKKRVGTWKGPQPSFALGALGLSPVSPLRAHYVLSRPFFPPISFPLLLIFSIPPTIAASRVLSQSPPTVIYK